MKKKIQRSFSLGSEWLYYKLYAGHKTCDQILTQVIAPIASDLLNQKIIHQWFFIRYADPKHHLRIRFNCTDAAALHTIILALRDPLETLLQQDLLWKVQTDTYHREIERYGANTMELSEQLFCYDSTAVAGFLDLIEGDEGEQLRWLFGLRSIDYWLTAFQLPLAEKLLLLDRLKTGFGEEFGMSRPLKKQLDNKFRNERKNIEHFLTFTAEEAPDYLPILEILNHRQLQLQPIALKIRDLNDRGLLELPIEQLLGSYIHMLMNRLFKSKNRLNEMVCYDFLYRYYRSQYSRKKGASSLKTP